jgi:hypothetical protein
MDLSEKAVLARLSSGLPGEHRQDPTLTSKVKKTENLGNDAGRWVKHRFPKAALEPAKTIIGEARAEHYRLTLPWDDMGRRILPTTTYLEYMDAMRKFRQRFEVERATFDAKWDEWMAWAQQEQNGTYDPSQYNREECKAAFQMRVDLAPVPKGSDFRVSLQQEDINIMRTELDERLKTAVHEAQTDLWERLKDPLRKMVEKLSDPEAIFRDTLIGNLADIVELVPKLNLTADPVLNAFADDCRAKLLGTNAEVLRTDEVARSATAKAADAILKRMEGLVAPAPTAGQ